MASSNVITIAKAGIRLHSIWRGMKSRCENLTDKAYANYGGRGIAVEWETFDDFFSDMYATYKPYLTLDREDNDGNYSKDNCRWATPLEQANNRRTNRYIEHNGERLTISQWSDKLELPRTALHNRINILGWDIGRALMTPKAPRSKIPGLCYRGHELTKENTYTPPKRPNRNDCRACLQIAQKTYKQKRMEVSRG